MLASFITQFEIFPSLGISKFFSLKPGEGQYQYIDDGNDDGNILRSGILLKHSNLIGCL